MDDVVSQKINKSQKKVDHETNDHQTAKDCSFVVSPYL